jgi:hypothetical protein
MAEQAPPELAAFGRIRGVFWGLLIASLLLAMAVPAATLLRAATSSLQVRACVWPPTPAVNAPAHLIIHVLDDADQSAVHGPWGQITANWDMAAMPMGAQQAALSGQAGQNGVFSMPLMLTMVGSWWAHVSIQTPGRPTWQTHLRFSVLPLAFRGAPTASASPPPNTCASREGRA